MHRHACKQDTFWFCNRYFQCYFAAVVKTPFTCQGEKEDKKGLWVSNLNFYGLFSNDIMAVKGLKVI